MHPGFHLVNYKQCQLLCAQVFTTKITFEINLGTYVFYHHNIFPEKNLLGVNTLLKNVVSSDMIMHGYSCTSSFSLHLGYE